MTKTELRNKRIMFHNWRMMFHCAELAQAAANCDADAIPTIADTMLAHCNALTKWSHFVGGDGLASNVSVMLLFEDWTAARGYHEMTSIDPLGTPGDNSEDAFA